MKRIILLFFSILFCTNLLADCFISTFSSNFSNNYNNTDVYFVKGIKLKTVYHGIQLKVLEDFKHNLQEDTIMVWCSDGNSFRVEYASEFNDNDTLCMLITKTDLEWIDHRDKIPYDIETPDDYMPIHCSFSILKYSNGFIAGRITSLSQDTAIPISSLFNVTLAGKIVQIANPCLASPCLPGIVYAFKSDTTIYILSIDNHWEWSDSPLIINSNTFELNDSVVIIGRPTCEKDVNSENFYAIEVDTAYKITTTTTIEQFSVKAVQVYPNPCNSYLNIDLPLDMPEVPSVQLFNSAGQLEFDNCISSKLTIDMSNYRSGIYLLRFNNDKKSDMIIIKR